MSRGPGNGPRGDVCPNWSSVKSDRCAGTMRPTGPKRVPTGELGTHWACEACGYDVTVYRALACSCARNNDGSVTTFLCPVHADTDPCLTMSTVTGRRRRGSIRRGVCSHCGHTSRRT